MMPVALHLDFIRWQFERSAHVVGVMPLPATWDPTLSNPLMMMLKGGEALVGRDCAVTDMEVVPCVTVDEAVWFADLFGGPLANRHFAICQTCLPN
jgi:hypothetical protein